MSQPEKQSETPTDAAPTQGTEAWPAEQYKGDEVQSGLVAIVGVFAAVVLLLIIVLVQAWFYTWKGEVSADRAQPTSVPGTPLGDLREKQQQQLADYRWIDRDKHIAAIPIDRAMEIVAGELGARGEGGEEMTAGYFGRMRQERPSCRDGSVILLFVWLAALGAPFAHGQPNQDFPAEARVTEKPDAQVPLDIEFQDEDGKTVRLGDYFKPDRPVLLTMIYYRCPSLCNLTLNDLVKVIRPMALKPGRDYEVVVVGFDPREGPELAKAKKETYMSALGRADAAPAWHFLSSSRPAAARAVGEAIGFGYTLDAKGENYLHQVGVYVCTPEGRVARTICDLTDFDTKMLNDSLINASQGKISRGLFGVALSCGLFHYDPTTGKYTWAAVTIMRVSGITTVLVLAAGIGMLVWRDSRKRRAVHSETRDLRPKI